jgi:hypothetical protein
MIRCYRTSLIFALWLMAVSVGFASLAVYKATPGAPAEAGTCWPTDSTLIQDTRRPTLLFFAHPRCPCTESSLTELETALVKMDSAMDIIILSYEPHDAAVTWNSPNFRRRAERIRGARVIIDIGGAEARRFGATTSGHTFIYSVDGRLVFRGGVTGARGHVGANPGRTAVARLGKSAAIPASTPVFGCPLFVD